MFFHTFNDFIREWKRYVLYMSYTPSGDILCRFWTVIYSKYHDIQVYRPQNYDKILIFDFDVKQN